MNLILKNMLMLIATKKLKNYRSIQLMMLFMHWIISKMIIGKIKITMNGEIQYGVVDGLVIH